MCDDVSQYMVLINKNCLPGYESRFRKTGIQSNPCVLAFLHGPWNLHNQWIWTGRLCRPCLRGYVTVLCWRMEIWIGIRTREWLAKLLVMSISDGCASECTRVWSWWGTVCPGFGVVWVSMEDWTQGTSASDCLTQCHTATVQSLAWVEAPVL
jgi:hypothetical protein